MKRLTEKEPHFTLCTNKSKNKKHRYLNVLNQDYFLMQMLQVL